MQRQDFEAFSSRCSTGQKMMPNKAIRAMYIRKYLYSVFMTTVKLTFISLLECWFIRSAQLVNRSVSNLAEIQDSLKNYRGAKLNTPAHVNHVVFSFLA
jgi:hypothetical protein